tara:strand:- start:4810 stop:6099 length:1290 start_codon:yes stop_codon:yes gene_type:complete
MGHHFTVDGRELIESGGPKDPQISLQEQMDAFESAKQQRLDELRNWRNGALGASDWTQVPDGALDSTTKAAWATYRDKLRDLPSNAKAPNQFAKSDWPLAPGQSEITDDVYIFIPEFSDPLGIGSTSWVGNGTETTVVYTTQTGEISGVGTDIISTDDIGEVSIGDILKTGSITGTVAGIKTDAIIDLQTTAVSYDIAVGQSTIAIDDIGDIGLGDTFESGSISEKVIGVGTAAAGGTVYNTVSLASTIGSALDADAVVKFRRLIEHPLVSLSSTISSGIGTGDVVTFERSKSVLVEQTRPTLSETVGLSTTKVVAGGSFNIIITDTNTTAPELYGYTLGVRNYPFEDIITSPAQGNVIVTPSGTTGVSTITVSIASTIGAGGTVGDVEEQQSVIAGRNFVIDVNVENLYKKEGASFVGFAATVGVTTT